MNRLNVEQVWNKTRPQNTSAALGRGAVCSVVEAAVVGAVASRRGENQNDVVTTTSDATANPSTRVHGSRDVEQVWNRPDPRDVDGVIIEITGGDDLALELFLACFVIALGIVLGAAAWAVLR